MFFYFDPMYMVIMAVSLILSTYASSKVKSAFKKYKQVPAASGLTGAEVAQKMMERSGIKVAINPVNKKSFFGGSSADLSDHYDPRSKTVRLSPQVYGVNSVAAYGIAAHEVGHALQHAQGYKMLMLRNWIAPVASIGSNLSYWLIILGYFMQLFSLVEIGILLFGTAVFFQLVTLPVEFDASRRAKDFLLKSGLVNQTESKGVAAVLNAAALTYVAAAATALLNLAYLIFRYGGRR